MGDEHALDLQGRDLVSWSSSVPVLACIYIYIYIRIYIYICIRIYIYIYFCLHPSVRPHHNCTPTSPEYRISLTWLTGRSWVLRKESASFVSDRTRNCCHNASPGVSLERGGLATRVYFVGWVSVSIDTSVSSTVG